MTDDELKREVRDLVRFRFAATPEEAAEALGLDVNRLLSLALDGEYYSTAFA